MRLEYTPLPIKLEKLSKWCDELQNPSRDSWEDLKSDLPINLRLM
jgi:hypothetical protein